MLAARDGERFVRSRRFEHAPALRHERDPHQRAHGAVIVRDEHGRRALVRARRLIPHGRALSGFVESKVKHDFSGNQ